MYSFHAPEAKRLYDFEPLPWDSHGNMASQRSAKSHHTAPSQICFLSAATGKAFTTVFAGFAFTLVSLPKIIFVHAFVATVTRLFSTLEQAFVFKPCSVAIAFNKAPFV